MICICKQRGSSTNSPLPASSLTDPQCPSPPPGALWEVAVSQLAGNDIHSNPFSCGSLHKFCTNRTNNTKTPLKPSICRTENMEAGCCGHAHRDEAMDDGPSEAMEGAVQGPSCLSKPEMQEGFTTATPSLFEEPRRLSWGQEEASKLQSNRKRRVNKNKITTF